MSVISHITDKFGDALGSSKFAQDRKLVRKFAGGSITREDYEGYKKNGTVDDYFGHVLYSNPHKSFYGLTPSFGYNEAQKLRDYMLATDVLSFLKDGGVTFDLDDPKNKRTLSILTEGVTAYNIQREHPPPLMEPYCDHPSLRDLLDIFKREEQDHTDGPIYPFKTATKDQLDEMRDNGIGF
tara:strand:+ start:1802 stop:2347 length:546 start_codon:yes stop_codon:yes gene_type:complete